MNEGWMKDEWRMNEGWMKDKEWMMKYDDFKLLRGFDNGQTNRRTDICDCRVAFATEKLGLSHYPNNIIDPIYNSLLSSFCQLKSSSYHLKRKFFFWNNLCIELAGYSHQVNVFTLIDTFTHWCKSEAIKLFSQSRTHVFSYLTHF